MSDRAKGETTVSGWTLVFNSAAGVALTSVGGPIAGAVYIVALFVLVCWWTRRPDFTL